MNEAVNYLCCIIGQYGMRETTPWVISRHLSLKASVVGYHIHMWEEPLLISITTVLHKIFGLSKFYWYYQNWYKTATKSKQSSPVCVASAGYIVQDAK